MIGSICQDEKLGAAAGCRPDNKPGWAGNRDALPTHLAIAYAFD